MTFQTFIIRKNDGQKLKTQNDKQLLEIPLFAGPYINVWRALANLFPISEGLNVSAKEKCSRQPLKPIAGFILIDKFWVLFLSTFPNPLANCVAVQLGQNHESRVSDLLLRLVLVRYRLPLTVQQNREIVCFSQFQSQFNQSQLRT